MKSILFTFACALLMVACGGPASTDRDPNDDSRNVLRLETAELRISEPWEQARWNEIRVTNVGPVRTLKKSFEFTAPRNGTLEAGVMSESTACTNERDPRPDMVFISADGTRPFLGINHPVVAGEKYTIQVLYSPVQDCQKIDFRFAVKFVAK